MTQVFYYAQTIFHLLQIGKRWTGLEKISFQLAHKRVLHRLLTQCFNTHIILDHLSPIKSDIYCDPERIAKSQPKRSGAFNPKPLERTPLIRCLRSNATVKRGEDGHAVR